jgi:hypothetical protein
LRCVCIRPNTNTVAHPWMLSDRSLGGREVCCPDNKAKGRSLRTRHRRHRASVASANLEVSLWTRVCEAGNCTAPHAGLTLLMPSSPNIPARVFTPDSSAGFIASDLSITYTQYASTLRHSTGAQHSGSRLSIDHLLTRRIHIGNASSIKSLAHT